MPTDSEVPSLRIPAYMSLEQAMAEVRKFLEARDRSGVTKIALTDDGLLRGSGQPFPMQGAYLARLEDIADRLDSVEPHSKLGAAGVFLKRIVRKAIGWYSRPAHEFDRTTLEALQQVHQDMFELQQQIAALQASQDNSVPASQMIAGLASAPSDPVESLIELSKTLAAVQLLRQSMSPDDSQRVPELERLLSNIESDAVEKKNVLLQQLKSKLNR